MNKVKAGIGFRFGAWSIIAEAERSSYGAKVWRCKCDCGTVSDVLDNTLRYGKSKSCGCRGDKGILGMRYGSLVVTEIAQSNPRLYRCECDCGGSRLSIRGQLTNGSNRTCKDCTSKATMNSVDKKSYTKRLNHIKIYNLTEQDLRDKIDEQRGCCAICKEGLRLNTGRSYHIDHDHISGKTRGILCGKCNVGIGMLGDSKSTLNNAIVYIDKYHEEEPIDPLS